MSEERVQFIKEQLAAGKSADEIRREAISHGHGTQDFDADFAAASGAAAAPTVSTGPAPESAAAVPPPAPEAAATGAVPPPVAAAPAAISSTEGFIGAFALIQESFAVAKNNIGLLGGFLAAAIGLIVLGGVLFGLFVLVGGMSLTGGAPAALPLLVGIAVYLAWLMAFIIASVGLVYALMKRREAVSYWNGVSWALKHFWQIFWISLLMQLVISGGYLFLIIPGLVVALYASFGLFTYISEGQTGLTALLRSTELVYGNWWGVLGRILLFIVTLVAIVLGFAILAGVVGSVLTMLDGLGLILGVLGVLTFVAFYLFTIAWGISFSVVMIESLQSFKPTKGNLWDTMKTTRIIYIVLAVIGVPMMFLIQGANFYNPTSGIGADPGAEWYLEDDAFLQELEALEIEIEGR